jgi:probable F420-dependent oxidoreductase
VVAGVRQIPYFSPGRRRATMRRVKLGLFGINLADDSSPDWVARTALAAEQAGFDSIWAGEHIVVPDPRVPPSPMDPTAPALDIFLGLAYVAAHTTTLRLATGIVILPQRNPVVLAKEIATLDVLSRGRFTLGVGVGYLEPEFRAIGADFATRGARTDEYLDAMAHLWYDEHPSFQGRFVEFDGVNAYPRPVQRPIPIVVGGRSRAAYRRAVGRGNGWYGYNLTPDDTAGHLDGLRAAAQSTERPADLGELEISVTPRVRMTRENVARFAELGVHRLIPYPRSADDVDALLDASVAAVSAL